MFEFTEPLLLAIEAQRHSAGAAAKRARFLDLLDPRPGERILDVGCGSGAYCRALAPFVAPDGHVTGIDPAPVAVELANRLAVLDDGSVLSFGCADGHDLPFSEGAFDAALCINVLEYCQDPVRVLGEIRRVLRPGGRLLVANADEDTRVFNGHDRELGRRITRAIADRGTDPWVGRRLVSLLTAAGFRLDQEVVLVESEREYAPRPRVRILPSLARLPDPGRRHPGRRLRAMARRFGVLRPRRGLLLQRRHLCPPGVV